MSAAEKKKLVDMCLVHGIPATDEQWLKFEPHFAVGGAKLRWNLRKMMESGELHALGPDQLSADEALESMPASHIAKELKERAAREKA